MQSSSGIESLQPPQSNELSAKAEKERATPLARALLKIGNTAKRIVPTRLRERFAAARQSGQSGMEVLAGEEPGLKLGSREQNNSILPDRPVITLGGVEFNLEELFSKRNGDMYIETKFITNADGSKVPVLITLKKNSVSIMIPGGPKLSAVVDTDNTLALSLLLKDPITGDYYDKNNQLPRGRDFFYNAYKFLSEHGTIDAIEGAWNNHPGWRDNYDIFKNRYLVFRKQGMTRQEAVRQAALQTWTGKLAESLGFVNAAEHDIDWIAEDGHESVGEKAIVRFQKPIVQHQTT